LEVHSTGQPTRRGEKPQKILLNGT